jgi:hypothetical protein
MLPPKHLRMQRDQYGEKLEAARSELEKCHRQVQEMDKEWDAKKGTWIREYVKANETIKQSLSGEPNAQRFIATIDRYFQTESSASTARYRSQRDMRWQRLSSAAQLSLAKYINNAYYQKQMRDTKQPTYGKLKARSEQLPREVQFYQTRYEEISARAEWKPSRFLLGTLLGVVQFILTIWLLGLFLEVAKLGVNMADDLQAIRGAVTVAKEPTQKTKLDNQIDAQSDASRETNPE